VLSDTSAGRRRLVKPVDPDELMKVLADMPVVNR